MGKLENLNVERTDGVDRPATGRTWVITKSAEAKEIEKDFPGLSRSLIEALAKEEGLSLGDETADALKALADALDIEFPVVEKAEEEQEAPEAEATDENVEKDDAPVTRGEIAEIVEKALHRLIEDELGKDEPVAKSARSRQARSEGDERTIEKGQGLFEDIVFDQ